MSPKTQSFGDRSTCVEECSEARAVVVASQGAASEQDYHRRSRYGYVDAGLSEWPVASWNDL